MTRELDTFDERELVGRLKNRDGQAMLALYDRFGKLIYSIILRAVNDAGVAEDLTQETLLRVWNRIATFQEERGNLEAWLVTVARNQAFDYLRSLRNAPKTAAIDESEMERCAWRQGAALSEPERLAQRGAVEAALASLKPEQREVMELAHFHGMSQTEIASVLKRPLGTVKGLARSATRALRMAISEAGLL